MRSPRTLVDLPPEPPMLSTARRRPLLAGRGTHAVSEHDRNGQDETGEHQTGGAQHDGPACEVGDHAYDEGDDRDAECEVTDPFADERDPGNPRASNEDGVVVHHAVHPCAPNVCSI